MDQEPVVLGVDIGGTKVAVGLVDAEGKLLFKVREPMKTDGTDREAMAAVHTVIRTGLEAARGKVRSIGVASPGPLDIPNGVVLHPPNLPCWVNFPLAEVVRSEYGLPTRVDNDANAAGLAEAVWGAAKDYQSVFYVTVGTGIGTAILFDREIFYGRTGMAGEGGHMTIDFHGAAVCGCGKRGCVEGLASGRGIARRAQHRVQNGEPGCLLAHSGENVAAITARTVEEAWRTGDRVATEVLSETMDVLTVWLGNVIDLLDPEVIVVGGGLGNVIAEWFGYMREQLPKWSINPRCQEIPLLSAKYGVDAGIVGAAALCFSDPSMAAAFEMEPGAKSSS